MRSIAHALLVAVACAAAGAALVDEQRAAVGGEVDRDGSIEDGHVALLRRARLQDDDAVLDLPRLNERTTVRGDVLERNVAGPAPDQADLARKRDGT